MQTIGATDITSRLTELLDRTAHGEAFEITLNGRPVGRLVPPADVPAGEPTFTDFLIDSGPRFDDLEPMKRPAALMRDPQL